MVDLSKLSAVARPNTVHVSLPADVLHDYDKFQSVQKDILGRLGHLGCTSGWDIRWDIFRRFEVNEQLKIVTGPQF